MLIKIIPFIFIIAVALIVYKVISSMMRKTSEESSKILNECKTEEERQIALKNLKKKNIRKGLLFYFIMMILILIVGFLFILLSRVLIK